MGTQHLPSVARLSWPGVRSDRMTDLLVVAPLIGFIIWLITRLALKALRNTNLPPGPKGLPILGDLLHIGDQDWLASPQRRDEYGDNTHISNASTNNLLTFLPGEMMYVSALGQGVLVINSQRVAIDLLEKRSTIYSDRPRFISAGDFSTKNMSPGLMQYGEQ